MDQVNGRVNEFPRELEMVRVDSNSLITWVLKQLHYREIGLG